MVAGSIEHVFELPSWVGSQEPVEAELLLSWCGREGVEVLTDGGLPGGLWGVWDPGQRVIWLSPALRVGSNGWLATLAHETFHVAAGHEGHQRAGVEARIDEVVAARLVDGGAYAFWEREYGGHVGGIADALEMPVWVVEAYQRHLAHTSRSVSACRC